MLLLRSIVERLPSATVLMTQSEEARMTELTQTGLHE